MLKTLLGSARRVDIPRAPAGPYVRCDFCTDTAKTNVIWPWSHDNGCVCMLHARVIHAILPTIEAL